MLLSRSGSVFPQAVPWGLAAGFLTAVLRLGLKFGGFMDVMKVAEMPNAVEVTAWSLFTSVLGFLIVFRAQLAYSRYWEGITLVEQAKGEWVNATSNLVAFCTPAEERKKDVRNFQLLLTKLMSLLLCASLCDLSDTDPKHYQVLDLADIDAASLSYLRRSMQKREIIMQWIQRMIVDSNKSGILDVAPPILSRVWQELSIGIVHFNNAKKLHAVRFPFPFAQTVWVMLVFFTFVPVPLISSLYLPLATGPFYCMLCTVVFWSIHYIAIEIELPFGSQANALPLAELQDKFNESLTCFLEERTQVAPTLALSGRAREDTTVVIKNGSHLVRQEQDDEDDDGDAPGDDDRAGCTFRSPALTLALGEDAAAGEADGGATAMSRLAAAAGPAGQRSVDGLMFRAAVAEDGTPVQTPRTSPTFSGLSRHADACHIDHERQREAGAPKLPSEVAAGSRI